MPVTPPPGTREAIQTIRQEVAGIYPYFDLRGLDWDEICERHLAGPEPIPEDLSDLAAAWVAELGDAHTAIKKHGTGGFHPPYRGRLKADGIHLSHVPAGTAAHEAGVRPSWVLAVEDPDRWARITGCTPQQAGQVSARRALSFSGEHTKFTAANPADGRRTTWVEAAKPPTIESTLNVSTDAEGDLVVRLATFSDRVDLVAAFDEVLQGGAQHDHLTLDLRGNAGGGLVMATGLRDRFLREDTLIGTIAFTDGRGRIAPRRERWASPSGHPCWPGRLSILTDAMTYSASEDFILGLQGLDHVRVIGEPTGGGSGRPRTIPVAPGVDLTISTAITYDRNGRPVEYHGIKPDAPPQQ